jgi:hypothetical protein
MKKLIFILAFFLCFSNSYSQFQRIYSWGYEWLRGKFDNVLTSPADTVTNKAAGSVAYLNGRLYSANGVFWSFVGLNSVADIPALLAYTGAAPLIQVMDNSRGGLFKYFPSGYTVDNGVVFAAALGGYWVRDVSQAQGVSVDWFGAKADGVTNNRTAIQAAVNYLHTKWGGKLMMGRGIYLADSLTWYGNIVMQGQSEYSYSETEPVDSSSTEGASILRLVTGSHYLINFGAINAFGFYNMVFDGNGAENAAFGDCFVSDINARALTIKDCKVYHFYHGLVGNNMGDARLINSSFRNCQTGAQEIKDSDIDLCTFSSNKSNGMYLNNGQVNITGCFVEWNRKAADSSATGIFLDGNCSRILITGCKFDHNTGNDVKIIQSTLHTPKLITLVGNQFKRSGWGSDVADIDRASIWVKSAINTTISSNTFWAAAYGAGGTAGLYAPLYALHMDSVIGLKFMSNSFYGIKQKVDLADSAESPAYHWNASGSAYYLQRSSVGIDGTYNTWIGRPDLMSFGGSQLTSGTLGSLTAGQWAWGDNNSLGYSTPYIRLTGDRDPNTVNLDSLFAYYDHDIIYSPVGSVNFSSDDARDHLLQNTILAGATYTQYLYTGTYTPASASTPYQLQISARQTTTGVYMDATVNFQINRAFNATAVVKYGSVSNDISDLSIGTANTDLVITITPDLIGTRFKLTIQNTTANNINFKGYLKW